MEETESGGLFDGVSKTQQESVPRQLGQQEHVNSPAVPSVSSCYVFKSLLQEFAQKVKLPNPTYNTIKEGPSHEPSFRSTVIVNDVTYESLPGFFSRRDAEQSAAEVALKALSNSGTMGECISQPVHDTGLCKNLLQAYAQKMSFAIPSYLCTKDERSCNFSCTVSIGGIKYIGGAARSKKEAELKAARTALLAIQSDPTTSSMEVNTSSSTYTVVPGKKKVSDSVIKAQETAAALKPKKGRYKKRQRKRHYRDRNDQNANNNVNVNIDDQVAPDTVNSGVIVADTIDTGFTPEGEIHEKISEFSGGDQLVDGISIQCSGGDFLESHATALDFHQSVHGGSSLEHTSMPTS
ncbi:double-stranded RNA-binding protein 1 isoform X2 [Daucus carota subsp. sativus]|uniref:double-stranded RNA-binding protein 1 isoform X2 n=1 Tax=Daucus carota subsp. sativus TaxID=79200 RepID=UPI0007EF7B55|nr:PREDICTED: double-stranded RNA-binding protein 1 [Daucus carota subsp. sativus]XP_017249600.1 PREDICTED: double-stranded RNA-binding protein 1 [Daucus carota subsp. sativus]